MILRGAIGSAPGRLGVRASPRELFAFKGVIALLRAPCCSTFDDVTALLIVWQHFEGCGSTLEAALLRVWQHF